ncbi:hypothetical protein AWZ03_008195 [Drosophila navojoa]|uniref:Uncharacterized protein n=1 Tax=Drosophila navojoa TaxID=7232 RepID=A0A484B9T3_DRONA|nr:hypothetical protein AWZ03_008195 [Drosophila navojoa]
MSTYTSAVPTCFGGRCEEEEQQQRKQRDSRKGLIDRKREQENAETTHARSQYLRTKKHNIYISWEYSKNDVKSSEGSFGLTTRLKQEF